MGRAGDNRTADSAKAGLPGARRGKEAGALDAAGAALGSFGLAAFGLVISLWHPRAKDVSCFPSRRSGLCS
jgi:hypothetical protein